MYECGFTAEEIAQLLNYQLPNVKRWIRKQERIGNKTQYSDYSAYSTMVIGAEDQLEALDQLFEWLQKERPAPSPTPPDSEVLAKIHEMQQRRIRSVIVEP